MCKGCTENFRPAHFYKNNSITHFLNVRNSSCVSPDFYYKRKCRHSLTTHWGFLGKRQSSNAHAKVGRELKRDELVKYSAHFLNETPCCSPCSCWNIRFWIKYSMTLQLSDRTHTHGRSVQSSSHTYSAFQNGLYYNWCAYINILLVTSTCILFTKT